MIEVYQIVLTHPDTPTVHTGAGLSNDVHALYLMFPSLSLSFFPSSLLFVQVDNRPCHTGQPSTCFLYASEAANFINAARQRSASFPTRPELSDIVSVRGVSEDIGSRTEEPVVEEASGKIMSCLTHTHAHTSKQNSVKHLSVSSV